MRFHPHKLLPRGGDYGTSTPHDIWGGWLIRRFLRSPRMLQAQAYRETDEPP